jgi:protein-S-isoprenylcysteine O-methyltransferase Ste14
MDEKISARPATVLAALMLSLVALAHLFRLIFRVEIIAGGYEIPEWISVFGVLVPGALAAALWRENRKRYIGRAV